MTHIEHQMRVLFPFRAVQVDLDRGASRFVELRAGTILATAGELDRAGLLTVLQEGKRLLVFGSDLRERTELLGQTDRLGLSNAGDGGGVVGEASGKRLSRR